MVTVPFILIIAAGIVSTILIPLTAVFAWRDVKWAVALFELPLPIFMAVWLGATGVILGVLAS